MRRKFPEDEQAHGVPKIYKNYNHFPPFRPIIDTTITAH